MTIKGYTVKEVLCETAQEITRELYLGLTLDRDARKPVLILSAQGGMEIEEVAETHPEAIAKLHPDPWRGPLAFEVRDLIFRAGLVMNTLDLVQREGGRAANFLDIGGGAKAEVVHSALELLASDPNVKGILINIFGGITRGDEVAHGIIDATRDLHLTLPLVVRM